ncbi:MAG: ABC transporter substrate-binding protein [Candidatus Brocadiae bacterium]|nr:ABC transporter substrate-binding protein [Candidatus Brocadiia bacterium]
MKRLLLPPAIVLAGFAGFLWLFRLSTAYEKPVKGPPPLPLVDDITKAAREFRYEPGVYGGTLNDWISTELKDLNLAISTDATTSSVLSGLVFETLLTRDDIDLEWIPQLALEVPTSSDDPEGRVYTLKLRQDVKWHDGAPFTADDVVFTYHEIILNESIPCSSRPALQMDVPDESGKIVKRSVKAEKVDDYTVRFTLPKRYALYLQLIGGVSIYPRHILKPRVDDGTFNSTWNIATPPSQVIGTGPYMPSEYVPGERFVQKRNPNYWKKDEAGNRLPYVETIVYNIIQNPDTQLQRFLVGNLDYLEARSIDLKQLTQRAEGGGFDVVIRAPQAGWNYLAFNQNPRSRPDGVPYVKPWKSSWFRDVRFRQAVAHCIDKDSINQIMYDGMAQQNWVPYTPKYAKYWTDEVRKYAFNLDEARRLLDDMGLTARNEEGYRVGAGGNVVEFVLTTMANSEPLKWLVTILEQDLKKVGVRLIPEYLEFNLLVRRLSQDWDWEAIVLGYTAGPEPLLGKTIWKSSEPRRVWNPRVPAGSPENRDWEVRLDQIFEEAYSTWDEKQKRFLWERDVELAHEWQRIAAENLPHIYLMSRVDIHAVYRRVRNRRSTVFTLMDPTRIYIER